MDIVCRREYQLRTSDFDTQGQLQPASILDIAQDIAGAHTDDTEASMAAMLERGILWVIVRLRYEVVKMPKLHQQVVAETWPLSPSHMGFQRECRICDLDGDTLVNVSSEWVFMDIDTRKLVKTEDVGREYMEYGTEKLFEGRMRKVPGFEGEGEGFVIVPGYSDLDLNGHVNNACYATYAMDALHSASNKVIGDDEVVTSMQMDFRREMRRNDEVWIFSKREDDEVLVKGVESFLEDGDIIFTCRIHVRKLAPGLFNTPALLR